ncbi:chloroplast protein import component Tic20-like protein [Skeletonema marinoi]|uniref:Chloroplast protein import component Tic20-like protein n=1 Tax=Skeletonema marinoi TaxID=267567 RepID=A0AAD8YIF7_9STRA|nr:chloroplast protein import component Tic20-like protein [Skeletonema marinoi]
MRLPTEVVALAIFFAKSCTLCFGFTSHSHINSMTKVAKKADMIRWSKEDNTNDEDSKGNEQQQQPINNLDIFGQPKDKERRKFEDEGDIRGPDRIKSCVPYMLPLIDGDSFGRFIYERIPRLHLWTTYFCDHL